MDFSSREYWENRYKRGRNSGAGSYGRLQIYKAAFINRFIELNSVKEVLDFGTGDGSFASLVKAPRYVGVDVSQTAIDRNRERFADQPELAFITVEELKNQKRTDLSMSIDVIYHLVEDAVFEKYMRTLFTFSSKYVLVYASDRDRQAGQVHVRHRAFTKFVQANFPEWQLAARIPNVYPYDKKNRQETSFADFFVYRLGEVPCTVFLPPAESDK